MPQAAHGLNDLVLRSLEAHVLRDGEGHDQLLGLGILLLEVAEWDDGECIHAGADEQAWVVLKDADDLVQVAVEPYRLAGGVGAREKRFIDGGAQHHHRPRVFLIEGADKAATPHREQWNRVGILRLRPAHDDLLDAAVAVGDEVAVPEEKSARAKRGHNLHVGSGLPDEVRVVVFKISAGAGGGWPAGGGRAGGGWWDQERG